MCEDVSGWTECGLQWAAKIPHGLTDPQPIFTSFQPLVACLWALWEVVLCGEPLLIFSPDYPARVAEAVLAVVQLIAPLEYAGDYRPYFTIYDGDFQHYRQEVQSQGFNGTAVILGATNPLVMRLLSEFPTCVVLSPLARRLAAPVHSASVASLPRPHEVVMQSGLGNWLQTSKQRSQPRSGHRFCRCSSDRRFVLTPDTTILRALDEASGDLISSTQSEACDEILRHHFHDLTVAFLQPLIPYIEYNCMQTIRDQGLYPNEHGQDRPSLQQLFDEAAFLEVMKPVGPFAFLPRKQCQGLYERFLSGANFRPWLAEQQSRIEGATGGTCTPKSMPTFT